MHNYETNHKAIMFNLSLIFNEKLKWIYYTVIDHVFFGKEHYLFFVIYVRQNSLLQLSVLSVSCIYLSTIYTWKFCWKKTR
jgi:hypothetical protein